MDLPFSMSLSSLNSVHFINVQPTSLSQYDGLMSVCIAISPPECACVIEVFSLRILLITVITLYGNIIILSPSEKVPVQIEPPRIAPLTSSSPGLVMSNVLMTTPVEHVLSICLGVLLNSDTYLNMYSNIYSTFIFFCADTGIIEL